MKIKTWHLYKKNKRYQRGGVKTWHLYKKNKRYQRGWWKTWHLYKKNKRYQRGAVTTWHLYKKNKRYQRGAVTTWHLYKKNKRYQRGAVTTWHLYKKNKRYQRGAVTTWHLYKKDKRYQKGAVKTWHLYKKNKRYCKRGAVKWKAQYFWLFYFFIFLCFCIKINLAMLRICHFWNCKSMPKYSLTLYHSTQQCCEVPSTVWGVAPQRHCCVGRNVWQVCPLCAVARVVCHHIWLPQIVQRTSIIALPLFLRIFYVKRRQLFWETGEKQGRLSMICVLLKTPKHDDVTRREFPMIAILGEGILVVFSS